MPKSTVSESSSPLARVRPYRQSEASRRITNLFADGGALDSQTSSQDFVGRLTATDVYSAADATPRKDGGAKIAKREGPSTWIGVVDDEETLRKMELMSKASNNQLSADVAHYRHLYHKELRYARNLRYSVKNCTCLEPIDEASQLPEGCTSPIRGSSLEPVDTEIAELFHQSLRVSGLH
ncbi:hypothetical protein SISSUDRAFT_1038096 [Sistotremastrum suecicum HHB10207 ss-3]|uniref:Uncharacterized protein n=1 Tax=Sistotremastrum suecicum HHB10207 ss-3 TaxID=1314776 RepID=A0A165X890_9AGAM|nr:hypothetical protein SISSUDRAFT_1038096 [Sistotremastrum suecicum HHB10207 ss-3]